MFADSRVRPELWNMLASRQQDTIHRYGILCEINRIREAAYGATTQYSKGIVQMNAQSLHLLVDGLPIIGLMPATREEALVAEIVLRQTADYDSDPTTVELWSTLPYVVKRAVETEILGIGSPTALGIAVCAVSTGLLQGQKVTVQRMEGCSNVYQIRCGVNHIQAPLACTTALAAHLWWLNNVVQAVSTRTALSTEKVNHAV